MPAVGRGLISVTGRSMKPDRRTVSPCSDDSPKTVGSFTPTA
jgi:hypothetical protein